MPNVASPYWLHFGIVSKPLRHFKGYPVQGLKVQLSGRALAQSE
jgi:hypothetical protein